MHEITASFFATRNGTLNEFYCKIKLRLQKVFCCILPDFFRNNLIFTSSNKKRIRIYWGCSSRWFIIYYEWLIWPWTPRATTWLNRTLSGRPLMTQHLLIILWETALSKQGHHLQAMRPLNYCQSSPNMSERNRNKKYEISFRKNYFVYTTAIFEPLNFFNERKTIYLYWFFYVHS